MSAVFSRLIVRAASNTTAAGLRGFRKARLGHQAGVRLLYTGPVAGKGRPASHTSSRTALETHFPAERSTPEAPARIPRADVDPRRPRDSQAPPRQGAQASLGLSRVETSSPSFSLTRLRRRLPARPLHGHA